MTFLNYRILDTGYPDAYGRDLAVADFQFVSLNWMRDGNLKALSVFKVSKKYKFAHHVEIIIIKS